MSGLFFRPHSFSPFFTFTSAEQLSDAPPCPAVHSVSRTALYARRRCRYGPFWTLTTVIFCLFIFSSLSGSITAYMSDKTYEYEFGMLSVAVGLSEWSLPRLLRAFAGRGFSLISLAFRPRTLSQSTRTAWHYPRYCGQRYASGHGVRKRGWSSWLRSGDMVRVSGSVFL